MATKPMTKSTAVAVKKPTTGAVISIREALAKQVAEQTDKIAPPTGNVIRVTQDKQFALPDGSKHPGPLSVVILDFVTRHDFWEDNYDAQNPSAPACFAISASPSKIAPSENSPLKQSTACAGCPMNEFGTDANGKGKACKQGRLLAVLPPDADADTPIWLLRTSPTAIKTFDAYVASVAAKFQLPPIGVVTEVSFDTSKSYATMSFGSPQPNGNVDEMFGRQEEARALLNREPDVSNFKPAKRAAVGGRRR